VEHACNRCGAAVEDGIPFCQSCGAPQIRVALAETSGLSNPAMTAGSSDDIHLPTHPLSWSELHGLNWSIGLRTAILSGVISAVAAMITSAVIPVPQFSLLMWMLGGGIISVLIYRRARPIPLTPKNGGKLGALSGVVAFALFFILYSVQALVSKHASEMRSTLEQQLRDQAARSGDPALQHMIEPLLTPQGMSIVIAASLVVSFLLFVILSAIGGALTAWATNDRQRH